MSYVPATAFYKMFYCAYGTGIFVYDNLYAIGAGHDPVKHHHGYILSPCLAQNLIGACLQRNRYQQSINVAGEKFTYALHLDFLLFIALADHEVIVLTN